MCFRVEGKPLLFSGDTLFPGGPGNTTLEGGDFATIIRSIDELLVLTARRRHDRDARPRRSTRRSAPSARHSTSGSTGAGSGIANGSTNRAPGETGDEQRRDHHPGERHERRHRQPSSSRVDRVGAGRRRRCRRRALPDHRTTPVARRRDRAGDRAVPVPRPQQLAPGELTGACHSAAATELPTTWRRRCRTYDPCSSALGERVEKTGGSAHRQRRCRP